MDGRKLDGDDLMVNARKIHGETIKGFSALDSEKITKLTPLLKD